jgi:hypothetical protein
LLPLAKKKALGLILAKYGQTFLIINSIKSNNLKQIFTMKSVKAVALALVFASFSFAGDIYEEISGAIRAGDAKQLASYFGSSIDLTLLNQEDVYAKGQAELLVKDFLSKNPPKTFSIAHKGSSREGTLFAIGTLATANNKVFRVSFTLKMMQGKYALQELRFEPQ